MKKVSERIDEHLKQRAAKAAALAELLEKSEKENRALNDEERKTFDEIEGHVKDIDETLSRLRVHEQLVARNANPIIVTSSHRNRDLPKGIGMARMVQLIMASQGNDMTAQRMAQQHYADMPDLARIFEGRAVGTIQRAAVAAATTTDPAWLGVLTYQSQLSSEIIDLVQAESILGQLTGLREVPFNVRIARETVAIGTAQWVGQGLPKPVGKGAYDFVTVPFTKAALICAFTEELARFSTPGAEGLIRDGLVQAVARFLDTEFISANAPVAGVSPGGIINGIVPAMTFPSSGSTLQAMQYDVTHAVSLLIGQTGARSPAWIMNPQNAIALGGQINAFGALAFPSVSANGTLAGYPVVQSAYVPSNIIVLVDQNKILHAADPNVSVDVSREASLQMDSAPANPPTPLISLWQQNMIALRAEKFEYWMRANDSAVVEITAVNYSVAPAPAAAAVSNGTKQSSHKAD
jgi:HK97 family phage major capsid protein